MPAFTSIWGVTQCQWLSFEPEGADIWRLQRDILGCGFPDFQPKRGLASFFPGSPLFCPLHFIPSVFTQRYVICRNKHNEN